MFTFYSAAAGLPVLDDMLVAVLPPTFKTMRPLLAALGKKLAFPDYYGKNLDAFWDCVRDLDGITARRVVVYHQGLPKLPDSELKAYLEVLRDTVVFWREHKDEHLFDVYFPEEIREKVLAAIAEK